MIQYYSFNRDNSEDFRTLIIPDVYDGIIDNSAFDNENLLCVGAVEDGKCVGAAVCVVFEGPRIEIFSIYVLNEHRRKGIGSGMIKSIISLSKNYLDTDHMSLHIEYSLPQDQLEGFNEFLVKNRFSSFAGGENIYSISSAAIRKSVMCADCFNPDYIHSDILECFDTEDEDMLQCLEAYCETFGVECRTKYSFYMKSEVTDESPAMVLVSQINDSSFELAYNSTMETDGEKNDESNIIMLLTDAALNAISKDYPDFNIVINGNACGNEKIWAALVLAANDPDTFYTVHCEASLFGRLKIEE